MLVKCPPEYCIKLEQFFLDNFDNKFNIRLVAESNFGLKASNETKQKMSISSSKRILDTETGIFYSNAEEVSNIFGINRSTLYGKLGGKRKNNTKFIYK